MKVGGKTVNGPNEDVLVFKKKGELIAFKFIAVLDYSEFEKLCVLPDPPQSVRPGGIKSVNIDDPEFQKKLEAHATLRTNWTILKSITNIDWDTVNLNDPATWANYKEDLKSAGFNPAEQIRIINKVFEVNSLSDKMLDEARKSFLALEAADEK